MPELVPTPLWRQSAAALLPRDRWRAIRAAEVARAGGRCEVCGSRPTRGLVCHEVWVRDHAHPDGPLAVLAGLRVQCPACDLATHLGRADSVGRGAAARARLAALNGLSPDEVTLLVEGAYERHATESAVRGWRVRIAAPLVARHADLGRVAADDIGA